MGITAAALATGSNRILTRTEVRVRKVLSEHAQLALEEPTLSATDDLYEAGLTSRASVNVMLGLEAEFSIEFPDNMLRRDVFESIYSMCEAVKALSDNSNL